MVAEMILDGGSHSLDASPFALTRLPAGLMSGGVGDSAA
jgi:hypothetical protein